MNTQRILIFFALFFSLNAFGLGGNMVNNGDGLAEKNFAFAFARIDAFSRPCLKADSCKLTSVERDILTKILNGLPEEYKNPKLLQFASEKKTPGFFVIDGQLKVAKTGNNVGDIIYINIDLLYPRNASGQVEPMSVSDALAILIHEFGHHYGVADHAALDLLGTKVSLLFQHQIFSTPLLPQKSDISVQVINPDSLEQKPDVLLNVLGNLFEIGSEIQKKVYCSKVVLPLPIGNVPDIPVGAKIPFSFRIHNLYWDKVDESSRALRFVIKSNLTIYCERGDTFKDAITKFKLRVGFEIAKNKSPKVDEPEWKYDETSLSASQFYDPWWKVVNLPFLPDFF